jgi:hypothetical protein
MFPLNTILAWNINIIMNKKYDNNNIIIASRAYFLQQPVLHMNSKASSTWSQTQGHRAIIQPGVPLAYPPESKIGTCH